MVERFLSKVLKHVSGCWLWNAQIYPTGYGSFYLNKKNHLAHRASWILFKGNIPENLFVCHKCDVKRCVNPDHLFLGSQTENMRDMIDKGRAPKQIKSLSDDEEKDVLNLYVSGVTQREIAKKYNIHQRTIFRYLHKHLPIKIRKKLKEKI